MIEALVSSDTKTCTKCGESKSSDLFYRPKAKKYHNWCRACRSSHSRNWANKNRERVREYAKDYYQKRRDTCIKAARRFRLRRQGFTPEQYDELMVKQNGVCAICGKKQSDRLLAADHDHATGKLRGLLCMKCNAALGLFFDDIKIMARAIGYLMQWRD